MNIDLLITQKGEAGLLCSKNLIGKANATILDPGDGMLVIEFATMDSMELNIPIQSEFFELLDNTPFLHVGSVVDSKIGQAYQVPLMILNDPYRMRLLGHKKPPEKPLSAFHYFVQNCVLGQPVHRDDMGDEATIGGILGDVSPSSLEFAPQLTKRYSLEVQNIAAPAMNVPGLGLGGNGSAARTVYPRGKTSSDDTDEE
jgi:hypothetical protein